jgi:O-antigen/teichoic acid export membrane protein
MLSKNIVAEILVRVCLLVSSFVYIPFIISILGLPKYGQWEILLSIATLLNLTSLPVCSVLIWRISSTPSPVQLQTARRLLSQAGLFTAIATLLGASMASLIPMTALRTPADASSINRFLLPLVILAQGLISCSDMLGASLTGLGANRFSAISRLLAAFSNYLVGGFFVYLLRGIPGLLAGLAAMGACGLISNAWLLHRKFQLFRAKDCSVVVPGLYDIEQLRYARSLAVGQVSTLVRENADRILVGIGKNPETTALLGLSTRLSSLIAEVNRYTFNSIVPEVSAANANGNHKRVAALADYFITIGSFATGLLAVTILSGTSFLFSAWIGRVPINAVTILSVVTIGTVAQLSLTGASSAICRGLARPEFETRYIVISLILNVLISIPAILIWGSFGKIAATAASLAVGSILFVSMACSAGVLPIGPHMRAIGFCTLSLAMGNGFRLLYKPVVNGSTRLDSILNLSLIAAISAVAYVLTCILLSRRLREMASEIARRCRSSTIRPALSQ